MRQNLQLMIEQAQLALLREQPDIYRPNLERAGRWLEEYYGRNARTEPIYEELRQLASHAIRSELPDQGDTLAERNAHSDAAAARPQGANEQEQEQGNARCCYCASPCCRARRGEPRSQAMRGS